MLIQKYLVITGRKRNSWGSWSASIKMVERKPTLKGGEVALKLDIELPSALFERPTLEAKLTIPEEAVPKSKITPEVTDNVEKIIKEVTGLNMVVSVVEHSDEEVK